MTERTFVEVGFDRMNELGFMSDQIRIEHRQDSDVSIISPAWDADYLLERGFLPKGTKVIITEQGGTDWDRKMANDVGLLEGRILTIKECAISDWSSTYSFAEIDGKFNTVMFEKVHNVHS